jgi:hypothetical protein
MMEVTGLKGKNEILFGKCVLACRCLNGMEEKYGDQVTSGISG